MSKALPVDVGAPGSPSVRTPPQVHTSRSPAARHSHTQSTSRSREANTKMCVGRSTLSWQRTTSRSTRWAMPPARAYEQTRAVSEKRAEQSKVFSAVEDYVVPTQ